MGLPKTRFLLARSRSSDLLSASSIMRGLWHADKGWQAVPVFGGYFLVPDLQEQAGQWTKQVPLEVPRVPDGTEYGVPS